MKFNRTLKKNAIYNFKNYKMNTLHIKNKNISYLNSEESKLVDEILMSPEFNYSIDQLMEIAGLSVAAAINKEVEKKSGDWANIRRILNISGPGSKNNLNV